MTQEKVVTLGELASRLGMDRSNARKFVLKSGLAPLRVRTPETGNQLSLALRESEAEAIVQLRQSMGYGEHGAQAQDDSRGHFYLLQLIPDIAPNRLKFGFATDVQARVQTHRTTAPTAVLVKTWPCKRVWEEAVISCLPMTSCDSATMDFFHASRRDAD